MKKTETTTPAAELEFRQKNCPAALTIAGSDSGGGAGAQADLLTFAAHGVFGTTALTALTAQNPASVSGVQSVPANFVREQAEQVARFFDIRAAKTGMLANAEIIHAVADFFETHREIALVVDPVMIATSGAKLLADDAVAALRERLLPLASLVTPNLDEAEVLLGEKFSWRGNPQAEPAALGASARQLAERLGVPVLLKGGHGSGEMLCDALAFPRSEDVFKSEHRRIQKINTHGSGCTLSAAIAANLAKILSAGKTSFEKKVPAQPEVLAESVSRALDYLRAAFEKNIGVGGGFFIAHLSNLLPRSRD